MRRLVLSLLAAAAITAATVGSVSAQGPQPGHLGEHGWTCFFVPGLGVHCAPPGVEWPPPLAGATPLLYWFDTGPEDLTTTDADFSGTEMLLPHAQYHGQPCPQEGLEVWADIGIARACHHN
jgi:hypothetical protein